MAVDPQTEYNDFLEKRQAKIDAERAKNKVAEERAEYGNGFNNPPAVRGTDGLPPSEPEQNPIVMAAKIDAGTQDSDDTNGVPTSANTVLQIKDYLDAQGIKYDGVTKKDDLLALIGK